MSELFSIINKKLIREYDNEKIIVEPWGSNSFRVRISMEPELPKNKDWALMMQPEIDPVIKIKDKTASVTNGNLICRINEYGFISFKNTKGEILLSEYWQDRQDPENHKSLMLKGRELKPLQGGAYKAVVRFKGNENEKFYGLGQHQEEFLNLKGCDFELAQRNSHINIPFTISGLGYGFLWNNPAYGRVLRAPHQ